MTMSIHFFFALELGLGQNGGQRSISGFMEQASEWAHKLAQEKCKQREKIEAENAKTLSDRNLIASKAPALWTAFKQDLQRYVEEIKNAMDGEEVIRLDPKQRPDRVAIIDNKGGELYCFVFHDDSVATPDDTYKFVVVGSDIAWRSEKFGNSTPGSIAATAVERAFRQGR